MVCSPILSSTPKTQLKCRCSRTGLCVVEVEAPREAVVVVVEAAVVVEAGQIDLMMDEKEIKSVNLTMASTQVPAVHLSTATTGSVAMSTTAAAASPRMVRRRLTRP